MSGEEKSNEEESDLSQRSVQETDELATAKLTLPHRFGMYRTPTKDVPRITDIEIDEPPFEPTERTSDPNHKVRNIFD